FKNVLLFVGGYLVYKLIKRSVSGARQQARPPQQDHAQSQSRSQATDRMSKKKPDLDKVGEYVEFEEINK
ncbi:MAG: hypothetical protein ACPGED_01185, partial [Flavobacteriales bacterium]